MNKSHWRAWGGIAFADVALAIRAFLQWAHLRDIGHPTLSAGLLASFWALLTVGSLSRSIRGRSREAEAERLTGRLEASRDPQGMPALAFRRDRFGQRLDTSLIFLSSGLAAAAAAVGHGSAATFLAWTFGSFSYVMLITLIRGFRFDSHFFLSERGIDCRFAVPSLQVSWEEIVSVRVVESPLSASVYVAITDGAVERFSSPMRRYMARLTKRKAAQYRWLDAFYFSSAREVASLIEHFRAEPQARALIPSPAALVSHESASSPRAEAQAPTYSPAVPSTQEDRSSDDPIEEKRRRAGLLAVGGALVRILAFFMPWVVATGARTVTLSGSKAGAPILSIGFSLVALALAFAFLMGQREMTPQLLVGLGAGAVLASIANFLFLMDTIRQVRVLLVKKGFGVAVTPGIGPWVQLVGALGVLIGGVLASRSMSSGRGPTKPLGPSGTGWGTPARPDVMVPQVSARPSRLRPSNGLLTIGIVLIVLVAAVAAIPAVRGLSAGGRRAAAPVRTVPTGQTLPPTAPTFRPKIPPTPGPAGLSPTDPPPAASGLRDAIAYQADVAHDGNARNAGVSLPLAPAWTRSWDGRVGYPVIADNMVFVAVAPTGRPFGLTDTVYALNADDGTTLWSHSAGWNDQFLGIAFDSGRVFVLDESGLIRAYSADTGGLDWSAKMPVQRVFTSPPTAWGGQLYVGGAGSGGTLYAVDEATGQVRWMQQVLNGDHSSPTLAGTKVFVGYSGFQIRGFVSRTGDLTWNYAAGGDGGGGRTMASYGGHLYARDNGSQAGVILDAASGQKTGTFTASTIPAFAGRTAYFLEGKRLRARDLTSMNALWSFTGDGSLVSAPLVVGGDIYEASSSGKLYELAQDGQLMGSFSLGASVAGPDEQDTVILTGMNAGDGLLAVAASGRLVAFR